MTVFVHSAWRTRWWPTTPPTAACTWSCERASRSCPTAGYIYIHICICIYIYPTDAARSPVDRLFSPFSPSPHCFPSLAPTPSLRQISLPRLPHLLYLLYTQTHSCRSSCTHAMYLAPPLHIYLVLYTLALSQSHTHTHNSYIYI
jgi:hypothetical protein